MESSDHAFLPIRLVHVNEGIDMHSNERNKTSRIGLLKSLFKYVTASGIVPDLDKWQS